MNYWLLWQKKIPDCCGSCMFIRYKTGEPTCKILPGAVCVFGFCDGFIKSNLITGGEEDVEADC